MASTNAARTPVLRRNAVFVSAWVLFWILMVLVAVQDFVRTEVEPQAEEHDRTGTRLQRLLVEPEFPARVGAQPERVPAAFFRGRLCGFFLWLVLERAVYERV